MGRMAGNEALSDFSFVVSLSAVLDFLLVILGPRCQVGFCKADSWWGKTGKAKASENHQGFQQRPLRIWRSHTHTQPWNVPEYWSYHRYSTSSVKIRSVPQFSKKVRAGHPGWRKETWKVLTIISGRDTTFTKMMERLGWLEISGWDTTFTVLKSLGYAPRNFTGRP